MSDNHIAIIDDDEPFRTALLESVSSLGYWADGFASGEDFMRQPVRGIYDVIVTDIHMPGISGLELMEQLAALGSPTPVVLITARSESALPARARAAGAICLLTKPFELEELVKCLETAVDKSTR